ncbi:MAG: AAA family ATPase [Nanopusillaceae archaeon]|jgi:predicted AAA+ superfamily ATPase
MWWKKYGFIRNPLDIRPNEELVGVDDIIKKVKNAIRNGEIFLLYGPIGSGKTSLAFKIKKELSDEYNIIYINGEYDKNIDKKIEEGLYIKFLFFKFRNKLPLVLILDEFYSFPEEVSKKLKYLYDNKIAYSIMLIQPSPQIMNATPSFLNRLHEKIEMKFPDEDGIIQLINKKLKGKIKFDSEYLRKIIRKNGDNVRSIFIELNNILENMNHPIENIIKGPVEEITIENKNINLSPTQIKILELLIGNKLSAREIARILNIPKNTASKYLNKMHKEGIVLREEGEKEYLYTISPQYINIVSKKIGK